MLQQLNMSWYLELFFQVLLPSITSCSNVARSQPDVSMRFFFSHVIWKLMQRKHAFAFSFLFLLSNACLV